MIAYFRARGMLRFPRKRGTGLWPPWVSATRQAGRGFWRIVMLKQKCRLDERSVIRQTANSVRYVAFSRMALGHPGRCASGGSIFHRVILPYGLTAAHAGMACVFDAVVTESKPAKWFISRGQKA